ncbi:MAG: hypothetical protein IJ366_01810 [Clostridia bacterium]|nr:hypothetical protein [Clostridia bacterium]
MRLSRVSVYKRHGDGWKRTVFDKAFVRCVKGVGFESGGRFPKSKMTVRIFSPSALAIEPEDMLECGIGGEVPSENALTVTEVCDNLGAENAHVRISAS